MVRLSQPVSSRVPPGAMAFGDLNDPTSEVSKLARGKRQYRLLGGTQYGPVGNLPKEGHGQRC